MIPAAEWLVLIPFAFALGLDVYLVLLLVPLFPLLPGVDGLPGELELLATPWSASAAGVLYLSGWWIERHRFSLLVWQATNFLVRVLAAGLLAFLLFANAGEGERWMAALVGASIAGTTQALRMGWGTVLDHSEGPIPRRPFRGAAEDAVAFGILWLALLADPRWGTGISLVLFLPAVITGGAAFRAARFTWPLLKGLALSLSGGVGWQTPKRFPGWLRTHEAGADPVDRGLRGTPAALSGSGAVGPFRDGWLLIRAEGPTFLYRTATRIWEAPLREIPLVSLERRSDLLVLRFEDGDRLAVVRGGPGAHALAAEFSSAAPSENL